ncbi:hypothetical protein MVG78_01170 [Roseomonas gilardii subsp. gilardii]|uniref:hypothetical protein n=1 Tax=Roseomonas gilardii TaxID=257708 RepID=UPI001FFA1701|nr:hypothetical protein [Roseomonas gilardii]UPG72840.1 hypothetical protein MVG78_01170 [Roseomonas gilardii subsp. gilardii]
MKARAHPSGNSIGTGRRRSHERPSHIAPGKRHLNDSPSLGIFWFLADAARAVHLLARPYALAEAESYGDCDTSPDGHADIWEAWQRRVLTLPLPALQALVTGTEYDAWPRGRIVHERAAGRFVLYADRQLMTPGRLVRIHAAFALPPERTVVRGDAHYSRAQRLPPDLPGQ